MSSFRHKPESIFKRRAKWTPAYAGVTIGSLLFAILLTACARDPGPVKFHADGYPTRLGDWSVVYIDGRRLALNKGVVPFDLNTPLFSDYAHKLRTLWMPPGETARYRPGQSFDFPVGTIFSKTFYYPKVAGVQANAVARTDDHSRDRAGEGLDLANVRRQRRQALSGDHAQRAGGRGRRAATERPGQPQRRALRLGGRCQLLPGARAAVQRGQPLHRQRG